MKLPSFVLRFPSLLIAAAAMAFVLFYAEGLPEEVYVVDDRSLLDLPLLRSGMDLRWWKTLFTPGLHIDFYPLRDLSYWVDFHVFGASVSLADGTWFRLQNLGWLGLAAWGLSRILERLGATPLDSAWVATIWLLNPIHAETVMWPSARKDAMSLAFFALFVLFLLRQKWGSAIFAHFLGLLSKASAGLVPFAIAVERGASSRRLPVKLLAATGILSITSIWIQLRLYSGANDMRFDYEPKYRILAALAAIGRSAIGAFWPPTNGIDVENWGAWLSLNRVFVVPGAILVVALVALSFRELKRAWRSRGVVGPPKGLFWLGLFWASYLPVSGLVFPHRNFYSIRYFEIPFMVLLIWGAISYVSSKVHSRHPRWILIPLVLSAAGTAIESRHWQDGYGPFAKGFERTPENPALARLVLNHLDNEDRWGKLSPERKDVRDRLISRLRDGCGPRSQSDGFENGHLCFWVWFEEIFQNPRLGLESLAPSLLIKSVERVSPQTAGRIRLRIESDGSDWQQGRLATVEQRIGAILKLCREEGKSRSVDRSREWELDHLLDRKAVTLELALSKRENLLSCFY